MKAHKNTTKPEKDIPTPASSQNKKVKIWVKQYQWKSRQAFDKYPKWFGDKKEFSRDWQEDGFGKHRDPESVLNSLKKEARSKFYIPYLEGRNWRAFNTITGEIVEFPEIENYYK